MAKRPILVTIISILVILQSLALLFLGGIFLLFGSAFILSNPALVFLSVLIIPLAIFILLLALITFIVGIGLLKGKNWARILYIIVGFIGLFGSITSLFTSPSVYGVLTMILPIFVISYLLFSRKVKEYFE